jgi:hypothetical protein
MHARTCTRRARAARAHTTQPTSHRLTGQAAECNKAAQEYGWRAFLVVGHRKKKSTWKVPYRDETGQLNTAALMEVGGWVGRARRDVGRARRDVGRAGRSGAGRERRKQRTH